MIQIYGSVLITRKYSALDILLQTRECTLIFSDELLEEFIAVVQKPKFKKYFSNRDIELLLETIGDIAEFVTVSSVVHICRDAKDNFLLALAEDADADFLITGDNDLLTLKNLNKTKIITIREFLDQRL